MNAPNRLDMRDAIVQEHCPAVMVPSHSVCPFLARKGHQYLVAQDGVYLEVARPAMVLMHRIAPSKVAMPYGTLNESISLSYGRLSEHLPLLRQFLADARAALPNEFAAWLIWDDFDRRLRYAPCKTIEATPGSVHFERPKLDEHESCAVDLHSHGTLAAFFSPTDDIDDAGEVKIAGVVGNIDTDQPTSAFRICALGLFIDVPFPAEAWNKDTE